MEQEKKYFRTQPLEIKQYDGSIVEAPGMVDGSQSLVAIAVARPGRPVFQVRPNSSSQLMSRTLMFGDIAVYSFNKTGEHTEGEGEDERLIIEGEVGTQIMESKSWLIMQTKDPSTNEIREPFVRSPWDVRQSVNGNYGNLQPAVMAPSVKLLADEAINQAAEILQGKVERNEPVRSQTEFAKAASAASRMADTLSKRFGNRMVTSQKNQQQGNIGDGAVTADDLI